ncbi:MAG: helix-hairpin-helix domain-containing protein, partial [Bacillus sp. (in: firmicutes)]
LAPNEIASLRDSIKKEYGVSLVSENASFKKEEKRNIQANDRKVPVKQQESEQDIKPIDINTATEEEFSAVPGLGLIIAKKIITIRQEIGSFQSIEHFGESLGLKPHTIERVRPYLYVSGSNSTPTTPPSDDPETSGRVLDI